MFKWTESWVLFDVKQDGYQTLTIPVSAKYKIELVAPGRKINIFTNDPGVQIIGTFELKKGQKITAALGTKSDGGCGGSFLVLESDEGQKPLLIAGGAGSAKDEEIARGNINQAASGNEIVGTSGKQLFHDGEKEDIYCGGAGYYDAPRVSNLAEGSVSPKSYKEGLTGGKGLAYGRVTEGGFGGGGGSYYRVVNGILERAAGSPGAAQKSMNINGDAWVVEEEVFQRIRMRNSTINTLNMATAKSKNYDIPHLLPSFCTQK